MKPIFLGALFFAICSIVACSKTKNSKSVKILRNCTGTYLVYNNLNYHVCNTEKTDAFANNILVTASFTIIDECNGTAKNAIVCMVPFPSSDWITVSDVY
jgi:hypothetical protein